MGLHMLTVDHVAALAIVLAFFVIVRAIIDGHRAALTTLGINIGLFVAAFGLASALHCIGAIDVAPSLAAPMRSDIAPGFTLIGLAVAAVVAHEPNEG